MIAFGIALAAIPLARVLGSNCGLVDDPAGDPLKIHERPVSVLGGAAVVVAALVAVSVVGEHPSAGVAAAVGIALAAGLLDDAVPLPPLQQALLQGSAGILLVAGGERLDALGVLGPVAVIMLVVACANGVNVIDGQDGLAGGLAAVAALGLAAVAAYEGSPLSVLALALAGSLSAFLIWNVPRARIFLGNSGAYAVGTVLAVLAVDVITRAGWRGLVAAGLCLGVFAFELFFTVVRRIRAGSVTAGDRLHSYDVLSAETGSRGPITLLFWAAGALASLAALAVTTLPLSVAAATAVTALACATLAGRRLWSRHVTASRGLSARRARSYVG